MEKTVLKEADIHVNHVNRVNIVFTGVFSAGLISRTASRSNSTIHYQTDSVSQPGQSSYNSLL